MSVSLLVASWGQIVHVVGASSLCSFCHSEPLLSFAQQRHHSLAAFGLGIRLCHWSLLHGHLLEPSAQALHSEGDLLFLAGDRG